VKKYLRGGLGARLEDNAGGSKVCGGGGSPMTERGGRIEKGRRERGGRIEKERQEEERLVRLKIPTSCVNRFDVIESCRLL
jgi:hypothetical protein